MTAAHHHDSHPDDRECSPSFTLEDHIASLRDVDPVKWAALQSEWEGSDRD